MDMSITSIDFAILAAIIISTGISWLRGFVKEAISLFFWGLALAASLRGAEHITPFIPDSIVEPVARNLAAFVSIFVVVIIIGSVVNVVVNKKINGSVLSPVNRSLGAVFGAARGILIICLGIAFLGTTTLPDSKTWQHSRFIPLLKPLTSALQEAAPKALSSEVVIDRYPGGITPLFKRED